MLDSLVRVSRRVRWVADSDVVKAYHSGYTTQPHGESPHHASIVQQSNPSSQGATKLEASRHSYGSCNTASQSDGTLTSQPAFALVH